MNNLSHTIRKFNRFELKYMITLQQAEQFKSALKAYLVPDEHGKDNGNYALTSLYYDSPGLRVTFDTARSFQVHRLHLHEEPSSLPMLPANQVVMEIKVNERMPTWLTELIADHNLQMVRVSKYCRSIEAAQNMPSLRWRNLPPESSEDVLATTWSVFRVLEQKMGIGRQ